MNNLPASPAASSAGKYIVHPVAALFPLLEPGSRSYLELEDHIKLSGQLEPIVVDGDMLLDGRNRLAICEANGIPPKVVEWSTLGIATLKHEWIFGKNATRRSLTEDQRTAIYIAYNAWTAKGDARERLEASKFKAGNTGGPGRGKTANPKSGSPLKRDAKEMHANSTAGQVAEAVGVSRYKVEQALALAKAAESGDQEAKEGMEAIKTGMATIKEIAKKARKPKRARTTEEEIERPRVVAHPELMKPEPLLETSREAVADSFGEWLNRWRDGPAVRKIVGDIILGRAAV